MKEFDLLWSWAFPSHNSIDWSDFTRLVSQIPFSCWNGYLQQQQIWRHFDFRDIIVIFVMERVSKKSWPPSYLDKYQQYQIYFYIER
jgi:hypothetical protein